MRDCAERHHRRSGGGRRPRRGGDVVRVQAEGDDDEHHLDALEEHPLERDDKREPVEAVARLVVRAPRRLGLFSKLVLLVVQRLQARRAEDRLAQPLQPEDQQERSDPELQR